MVIGALLLLSAAPFGSRASAAADVGYLDGGYSGSAPTAREPQSKLWFNDGTWWASMYSSSAHAVDIHRLNWTTQTWADTGVRIDERSSSFADTLWDGSKLYIVTGVSDQSLTCTPSTSGDNSIRILRFSYDTGSKTYSLDAGYPVTIASLRVQAVSLAKDSTGALWATWAYPTGSNTDSVFVTHSTTDTATWVTPYVVPLGSGATTMECGDYSAIVAYSGKIGVMYSNQNTSTMYFGIHVDGDPDTSWAMNNAASGTGWADNHVNVKSLVADPAGQVFAAMKTSLNGDQCPPSSGNAGNPLIVLAFLDNSGGWQRRTFSTAADCETRPLVQIDPEHRQVYVFATYPPPGASYGSGGSIYYKVASLDNPNFGPGPGTPFIQLTGAPSINNVSGTKQPLGSATGLVVLAADDSQHKYVHGAISLGADTVPPTVTSTAPASGAANVATNATVNATFSEPMNASTITPSTFTLTDTTASAAVPASVSYNGATNTATLTPTSPLPNSHTFSATITGGSGGVTDLAGNAMAANYSWSFTSTAPDTTPPTVTLTAPANGATVSGSSVSLSATASDNVAVDHVNFLVNGSVIATDTVSPYVATWNSTTVPNGPATIAAQAFDAAGNQATSSASVTVANTPPFSDGFESGNLGAWTIRTGGDGTASAQTAVVKTGVFAAKLTETSNTNSLSYIRKSFTSDQSELTISGDFQVASSTRDVPLVRLFDSSGTRRFSLYRASSGGGISYTDGAGTVATGSLLALNAWVHIDLHLIAGSGNATVQVSVNGALVSSLTNRTLTTTRTLQLGNDSKKQEMTLYADNISVTGPVIVPTPDTTITGGPSGTVNSSSASFTFTSTIPGSTFACSLDGAAATPCTSPASYSGLSDGSHTFSVAATANGVTDPTPATASWSIDTAPPVVTGTNPATGAVNVPTSSSVSATFNEAMSASSITSSTFALMDSTLNQAVTATVSYNSGTTTAILTPSAALAAGDLFTATVSGGGGGVTDLAGNPMASDVIWTFTTAAAGDTQSPTVTLTAPAQGATVSGSSVTLSADASDNVAVDHVDFLVGANVVGTANAAPYSVTWDSTTVSDGSVTITARAVDTSSNQASDSHGVTVSNGGTSSLFSDGFESGGFSNWTLLKTGADGSATVQSAVVKSGTFAARFSESSTSGSLAYARETLSADQTSLTITGDFQVFAEGTSSQNVPIIRLFNSSGTRLVSLYRQSASGNKVYVGYGGTNYLTTGLLPMNTWATFQLHIVTGSGNATVQVSINGSLVYSNTSATLAAVRMVQVGNETSGQPMGMYVDNIVVTNP